MNAHERQIIFDDDARTVLESWGSGGPNVLCLHGMTSSRKSWLRTAGAMELAYAVHAYDQRGHGDASPTHGPMAFKRIVRDCITVADAIPGGIDTLIGHSWGGAVAILGGRRFDVRRVVAVDPMIRQAGSSWYDEFLAELKSLFAHKGEARDAKVAEEYRDLGWGEIDIERKKHAVRNMTAEPIERLRDENPPETWDLRRDLEEYPKPLLLAMAGASESIVPLDDLRFVRERGGPNVSIRVFENQGHNLHRTGFERFTQELDTFLERTGP